MNFQTIIEELDRLYDEEVAKVEEEVAAEEVAEEEVLTEAADENTEEEIEIVDDEEAPVEDEPVEEASIVEEAQLVLECVNCGAIMIKAEADVTVDEEAGVANLGDACQYCESEDGHKVIGTFTPYAVEPVAEDEAQEAEEEIVDDEAPAEE